MFAGKLTVEGHYVVRVVHKFQRYEIVRLCEFQDRDAYLVWGKPARSRGGGREPLLRTVSRVEPFPTSRVVAVYGGSRALEDWNGRRLDAPLGNILEERE